jgi:DNA (cytosine-5)-methyltransferase 1
MTSDEASDPAAQLRALSLFSGAGGMDIGFEAAGFDHVASVEWHAECVRTLRANRPAWRVIEADVRSVSLESHCADVVHGGPPCQPFSLAGRGVGGDDARNMWPAFHRAVAAVRPRAAVAENVRGLLRPRFASFVREEVEAPLAGLGYVLRWYSVDATDHDVPQTRRRVFLVALRDEAAHATFARALERQRTGLHGGARSRLGLEPRAGTVDGPCPTIVSTLTSPRLTTSIDSGPQSQRRWRELGIWPCGVQDDRVAAAAREVVADPALHRMCVDDVKTLQAFPVSWALTGCRSVRLGMLGNAVPPAAARAIACALHQCLRDEPRTTDRSPTVAET